jgi:hypothetical protein
MIKYEADVPSRVCMPHDDTAAASAIEPATRIREPQTTFVILVSP